MKKLNIAVIGFGRSGCDIHGAFLRTEKNDICNVKYVVEADPARAAAAKEIFGCETLSNYTELFPLVNEIDFVTNASYSDLHYPITKDLLAQIAIFQEIGKQNPLIYKYSKPDYVI